MISTTSATRDDAGQLALLDGVGAERRADAALLDDARSAPGARRRGARAPGRGPPRWSRRPARSGRGRRSATRITGALKTLLVEDDRHEVADVLAGGALEDAAAAVAELEGHQRLAELRVALRLGVLEVLARHHAAAPPAGRASRTCGCPAAAGGVEAPAELRAARHELLHGREGEGPLDEGHVLLGDHEDRLAGAAGGDQPRAEGARGAGGVGRLARGAVARRLEEPAHARSGRAPRSGRPPAAAAAARGSRPPRGRSARESPLSSAAGRTIWNWRNAVCWITSFARRCSACVAPGSSTMIRSSPTFWIAGLRDAQLVHAGADDAEGAVDGVGPLLRGERAGGIVHLEGEMGAALEVEAERDARGRRSSRGSPRAAAR